MITTDEMIRQYGDQCYHKAVQMAVVAVNCGDSAGAAHFAAIARELTESGYHKHPKREEEKP